MCQQNMLTRRGRRGYSAEVGQIQVVGVKFESCFQKCSEGRSQAATPFAAGLLLGSRNLTSFDIKQNTFKVS